MINRTLQTLLTLAIFLPYQVQAQTLSAPCAPKKEKGSWDLSVAAGLTYSDGNTNTTLFSGDVKAAKETEQDELLLKTVGQYGRQDGSQTQDFASGSSTYNYKLNESYYLGAGLTALYDGLKDIRYRTMISPLAGVFLLKGDDYKLALEAGPSYTFQKVGDDTQNYLSPRAAERGEWKFSPTAKLFETVEYVVSVEDSGNYQINATAGLESTLTTTLALVIAINDRYDNAPALDREKNDIQIITSLKVSI